MCDYKVIFKPIAFVIYYFIYLILFCYNRGLILMQHRTFSIKHTWFFIPLHVLGKQQLQVVSDHIGVQRD